MGVALALAVPREHIIAHEALEHAGGGWPGYPGPFCQSPGGHLALRSYKLDGDLRVPRHLGRFRGEDAPPVRTTRSSGAVKSTSGQPRALRHAPTICVLWRSAAPCGSRGSQGFA